MIAARAPALKRTIKESLAMAIYQGCAIPEDLYYHTDYDSWIRFEGDSIATLGMTDIAQTAAGKLLQIRFKPVGKMLKAGRSAATIESAKWVGPFRVPFDAEILATNRDAFVEDVLIANRDPYGNGWLVRVRALNPHGARDALIAGDEAVAYFTKRIDEDGIRCFRCVDDPVPMDER